MKSFVVLILLMVFAFTTKANSPKLEYACMNDSFRVIQILKLDEKYILNLGYKQALSASKEENEDGDEVFHYDLKELQVKPQLNRIGSIIITNEDSGDFIFSLKAKQIEKENEEESIANLKCQKH